MRSKHGSLSFLPVLRHHLSSPVQLVKLLAINLAWLPLFVNFHANANLDDTSPSVIKFELKPVNCIAEYMGQKCELDIIVDWQLTESTDVCLEQQQQVLKCWKDKSKAKERLQISLQENTTFRLIRSNDNLVLTSQNVTINFLNKYRRRLKPKWSIF